ncbi:MAG: Uma2 family endonuclease [Hyphomicrobium sp.]
MAVTEPQPAPLMTAAEFMDWDGGGLLGKLELVNGVVRAMSPASGTHALLQANLAGLIWNHLRAKMLPCRVGTEAPVQPQLHANDNVRAPDLAVTCSPPSASKTFPDPVLIIEIMSPSNRKDTWDSIYAMATISSLTEILVVESEREHAEVFRRNADGSWPKGGEAIEAGGSVRLESISAEFSLAEVYAGTILQ